jgi:hypothetical protein
MELLDLDLSSSDTVQGTIHYRKVKICESLSYRLFGSKLHSSFRSLDICSERSKVSN